MSNRTRDLRLSGLLGPGSRGIGDCRAAFCRPLDSQTARGAHTQGLGKEARQVSARRDEPAPHQQTLPCERRPTIAISIRPIPVKLQGASSFFRKALLRATGGKGCTGCDSVSLPEIPIGLSGRLIDGLDLNGYFRTRDDGINSIGGRFPRMTRARHLVVANGWLAPRQPRTIRGVSCRRGSASISTVNTQLAVCDILWSSKRLLSHEASASMSRPSWKRLDNGGAGTISSCGHNNRLGKHHLCRSQNEAASCVDRT